MFRSTLCPGPSLLNTETAGFLALPDKSAFPTLFVIHYSLAQRQWLLFGLIIMGITVAGTAQDLHLIPFSCTDETPAHHHFGCKDTHYFINMQYFLRKIKQLGTLILRSDKIYQ